MDAPFWADPREPHGYPVTTVHPSAEALAARRDLSGMRVLVPQCGKTLDLVYLAHFAAEVVGVEPVARSVAEFFAENRLAAVETAPGVFRAGNITVHCRDLLALTRADLGRVDLVYDRTPSAAVPEALRARYAAKVAELVGASGPRFPDPRRPQRPAAASPRRGGGRERASVTGTAQGLA